MKKNYYEIVKYSIPKRYKGQKLKKKKVKLTEEEKENIYKNNEIELNRILNEENNNSKKINLLFTATFGDILNTYLDDKNNICINGNEISSKGFVTFEQCFNDDDKFTDQKNYYKLNIKEKILK